jgi:hypothetical protein
MNWLPEEILQLIYAFDGRYKQIMKDCFSVIDVQNHPPRSKDLLKAPEDITPYNLLRTYHYNYIERFRLNRKIILPKNGIEVLNPVWVEQNKTLVSSFMKF